MPVNAATYKTNIQGMISKIKARTTGKVPLFVILFPAEISKVGPLDPFASYRNAAYEIAAADPDNVTVLDWGARLNPVPTFSSTLGGLLHTIMSTPPRQGTPTSPGWNKGSCQPVAKSGFRTRRRRSIPASRSGSLGWEQRCHSAASGRSCFRSGHGTLSHPRSGGGQSEVGFPYSEV